MALRTGVRLPSPPVFARSVAESEDCRGEAQRSRAIQLRPAVASYDSASQTEKFVDRFHYVYILQSKAFPDRFYVGLTGDLRSRLQRHNRGAVPHTSKWAPWQIKTSIAFSDESKAVEFERYLKTSSGRAFAKKRL